MDPLSLPLIDKIQFRVKDQYKHSSVTPTNAFFSFLFTVFMLISVNNIFDLGLSGISIFIPLVIINWTISYLWAKYRNKETNFTPRDITEKKIKFESDQIIILRREQQTFIDLQNIETITIYSAMYEGYTVREFNSKTEQYYSGETVAKFELKDKGTIKCCFLIRSDKDLSQMTDHLKSWYIRGNRVKEYAAPHDDLAVLFRTDWSYNEYQELKEKLGVERFY